MEDLRELNIRLLCMSGGAALTLHRMRMEERGLPYRKEKVTCSIRPGPMERNFGQQ